MKRIVSLLFALIMALTISGCSVNEPDNTHPSSGPQDNTENQTQSTTTMPTNTVANPCEDENIIQIPTKKIYFSCPSGWKVEEETKTQIVMESEEALVGIFYDWQTPVNGALIDMVPTYSEKFLRDVSSYSKGYLRTSSIEVLESEGGSVGGVECAVFTGKANNDGKWDCHVYGYTLVISDVNIMVIGLVSAKDQDSDMIANIESMTDQIAASIRTEK